MHVHGHPTLQTKSACNLHNPSVVNDRSHRGQVRAKKTDPSFNVARIHYDLLPSCVGLVVHDKTRVTEIVAGREIHKTQHT